ncbi:MAG: GH92 family glycosyl hydrolase [Phocaeicola sp.]
MKFVLLFLATFLFVGCTNTNHVEERFTDYVDMRIGTGGHGHVFVGANVPFGFVQLGPTSVPQEWDWTSGYHESDSTIIGFSHTHLSGTGIGDLFDITVMPVVGDVVYARGTKSDPNSGLWSYGKRSEEVMRPGYYSVPLDRYGILAEMTATARVGMHRYTFPESTESAIVFDLQNGGCWDKATDTHMEAEGNHRIVGYRHSKGWADDQRVFFVAEFSKPFDSFDITTENGLFARASFSTTDQEQVLLKVGLSAVSIEGARRNLNAELSSWDFEATSNEASALWQEKLAKIKVSTTNDTNRTIFYTALYHTMIAPSVFCDVDGAYRGSDREVYTDANFTNYTTFSLWDTYRAAQPLMSILHPDMMPDIINTMIHIYEQQGKLPVWHLMGNETDCMVGNPGICVVADAIVKGIDGFDKQRAFEAIKGSAMLDERGMDLRKKHGYIPCDLFNESVAFDMEYAIADGAAAQAAKALGLEADYNYFGERSHSYRNFFDPTTRFMRGRTVKGAYNEPFNPFHSTHRADDYCEGNAWQYTWLAPHDVNGLVNCFASKDSFMEKLDSLFLVSSVLAENSSPDITGLIGQYAHGNEPSHHILYLYTMLGQPWKCADRVREVLSTLYHAEPDGLSGNEDVGQMSAWYILSSIGFYQVDPADGKFWFGTPLFDKVLFNDNLEVIAHNNSDANRYIQSIKLNGQPYEKPYISYDAIMQGGTLEFEMGSEPALWYPTSEVVAN